MLHQVAIPALCKLNDPVNATNVDQNGSCCNCKWIPPSQPAQSDVGVVGVVVALYLSLLELSGAFSAEEESKEILDASLVVWTAGLDLLGVLEKEPVEELEPEAQEHCHRNDLENDTSNHDVGSAIVLVMASSLHTGHGTAYGLDHERQDVETDEQVRVPHGAQHGVSSAMKHHQLGKQKIDTAHDKGRSQSQGHKLKQKVVEVGEVSERKDSSQKAQELKNVPTHKCHIEPVVPGLVEHAH